MRFLDAFERRAQTAPDRLAIQDDDRRLSYGDLNALADGLAARMTAHGLQAGDRIVVLRASMVTAYVASLAGLKSGIVFLLIDSRDAMSRVETLIATCAPKLIVADNDTSLAFARDRELDCLDARTVAPGQFDTVPLKNGAPCWLEPTSGSTGLPKIVVTGRAALDRLIVLQAEASGIEEDDRIVLTGEMWADCLFNTLMQGASLFPFDLKALGTGPLPAFMRAHRITGMQTFVAAFRGLATATEGTLPDLRIVRVAGEIVLRRDVHLFDDLCAAGAVFTNFYGSTECGFIAQQAHRQGAQCPFDILPIGRPVPQTQIDLLDEGGNPVPQGVTGEMRVRAPLMADGYLNNPEKSAETYGTDADGMRILNTGDLAFQDAEGLYHVVGRADDQVKVRGYSVRYSDVEAALLALPDISAAAVTSFLSPRGQRQLSAHVILRDGATFDERTIRAQVAQSAPAYLVPSFVTQHDAFPRTETGKVLRRALPNPLEGRAASSRLPDTLSGTQAIVAEAWRDVLGHGDFTLTEDFFDVGGDSLQAMDMVVALERRCQVRIGYETLVMQGATVQGLATRIDTAAQSDPRFVTLKEGAPGAAPIYVLPVENGEFSDWLRTLPHLPADIPVIGVHVRDHSDRSGFPRVSQQDLARHAVTSILADGRTDGRLVMGFSAASQVAHEAACLLHDAGALGSLLLADPPVIATEPERSSWHYRRILSPLVKKWNLGETLNRFAHVVLGRPARELHIADEAAFWRYQPETRPLRDVVMVSSRDLNPHRVEKEAFWRRHAGDALSIEEAPGDHVTVVRDPNAAALAQIVGRWWTRVTTGA